MHNLHGQKWHFQIFVFDLNSCRDLAFLYSDWRFTQRNSAWYITVSIPYFTVFVFSVKISWKFVILWILVQKLKSEFIIGGAMYTIYNFIHFSHDDWQILLMNCRFITYFLLISVEILYWFCFYMLASDPFCVLY